MPLMGRARITGIGGWLPERVVANQYFVDYLDTSDDWISSRTGISSRRFGGPTSTLAVEAGRQALDHAGLRPDEIDLLVLATSTPDQVFPQTAAVVQHQLGLRCGAFDINVACTGFVYATAVAASLTRSHRRVLVVGSEQMSRITDPERPEHGDPHGRRGRSHGHGAVGRRTGRCLGRSRLRRIAA